MPSGHETSQCSAETHHNLGISPENLPPPLVSENDQSDTRYFASLHTCRVCCLPRSASYHKSHPIVPGAKPPPPGICRRCRVTSVEETCSIVRILESEAVRLGISCVVPKSDVISHSKMRHVVKVNDKNRSGYVQVPMKVWLDARHEQEETVERERIKMTYRYVEPAEHASDPAPRAEVRSICKCDDVSAKNLAALNIMNDMVKKNVEETAMLTKAQLEADRRLAQHAANMARELDLAKTGSKGPSYSESDIRRLAREEVEHYRHAERLVAAHPDPYAHGRLVPMSASKAMAGTPKQKLPTEDKKKESISAPARRSESPHYQDIAVTVRLAHDSHADHRDPTSRDTERVKQSPFSHTKTRSISPRNPECSNSYSHRLETFHGRSSRIERVRPLAAEGDTNASNNATGRAHHIAKDKIATIDGYGNKGLISPQPPPTSMNVEVDDEKSRVSTRAPSHSKTESIRTTTRTHRSSRDGDEVGGRSGHDRGWGMP